MFCFLVELQTRFIIVPSNVQNLCAIPDSVVVLYRIEWYKKANSNEIGASLPKIQAQGFCEVMLTL